MNAQLPIVSEDILSTRLDEILVRASAGEAVFLHPSVRLRAA